MFYYKIILHIYIQSIYNVCANAGYGAFRYHHKLEKNLIITAVCMFYVSGQKRYKTNLRKNNYSNFFFFPEVPQGGAAATLKTD